MISPSFDNYFGERSKTGIGDSRNRDALAVASELGIDGPFRKVLWGALRTS